MDPQITGAPSMRGTIPPATTSDDASADSGSAMSRPATHPMGLVPSGIRPLDYRLGGILPNRPYVISGNPGTGKSVSCLEFAQQGLEGGETVVLIARHPPMCWPVPRSSVSTSAATSRRASSALQLDTVRRLGRATADAVLSNSGGTWPNSGGADGHRFHRSVLDGGAAGDSLWLISSSTTA
jgi:hypothetical protein